MSQPRYNIRLLARYALWLLCLLQSSCALKTYKQALAPEVAQDIKQVRVISHIDQEDLFAQFETQYTQLSGGFMLGSIIMAATSVVTTLIDYNISKQNKIEAKQGIKPILKALEGYNIDALLHSAIQRNKGKISNLPIVAYEAYKNDNADLGYEVRNQIIHNSPEDTVLVLTSNYSLTPDFRAVNITTIARLYQKEHFETFNFDKFYQPVYINKFIFQSSKISDPALSREDALDKIDEIEEQFTQLSNNTNNEKLRKEKERRQHAVWQLTELSSMEKKQISALAWSKDNGKLFKEALVRGIADIAHMINLDLLALKENYKRLSFSKQDLIVHESHNRVIRRKITGEDLGILTSSGKDDTINIGGIVYAPMLLP